MKSAYHSSGFTLPWGDRGKHPGKIRMIPANEIDLGGILTVGYQVKWRQRDQ